MCTNFIGNGTTSILRDFKKVIERSIINSPVLLSSTIRTSLKENNVTDHISGSSKEIVNIIETCKGSIPLYTSFRNQFGHRQICIHYIHQVQTVSMVGYQKRPPLHLIKTTQQLIVAKVPLSLEKLQRHPTYTRLNDKMKRKRPCVEAGLYTLLNLNNL